MPHCVFERQHDVWVKQVDCDPPESSGPCPGACPELPQTTALGDPSVLRPEEESLFRETLQAALGGSVTLEAFQGGDVMKVACAAEDGMHVIVFMRGEGILYTFKVNDAGDLSSIKLA